MRLLDVGCGWGSLVPHAAQRYGVRAVGVTLSRQQADLARRRVAEAGLQDQVEIRVRDYREIDDGPFDAVASVGMAEHVGDNQLDLSTRTLFRLLRPRRPAAEPRHRRRSGRHRRPRPALLPEAVRLPRRRPAAAGPTAGTGRSPPPHRPAARKPTARSPAARGPGARRGE
jgi:hypothetical protein